MTPSPLGPLTIVHTESHRQWGGQERRVFHEGEWMRARGHRLVLLAPEGTPVSDHARNAGWEVHPIAFTRLSLPGDVFRVRRLLREIRPDVLNTHGNTDAKVGLTAARGLGIPCVIRSRHITPPVSNTWYNRLLYRTLCHYVFTTSQTAADGLVRDLGVPGRVAVG